MPRKASSSTTTTTASASTVLPELQHCALALAATHGFRIYAERRDGERQLQQEGHPARNLVLLLGGALEPITSALEAA